MMIWQQLQVANFSGSLGKSQAGKPAIANIKLYNRLGPTKVA